MSETKLPEDPRRRIISVAAIGVLSTIVFILWVLWNGMDATERVVLVSRAISLGGCCLTPLVAFAAGWTLRAKRSEMRQDL